MPGKGRFAHTLPDDQEPVVRTPLAVGRPVGYVVHLRPLLTGCPSAQVVARPQVMPRLLRRVCHRISQFRRHHRPHRELDDPEPLVLTLRTVPEQLLLVASPCPTAASPSRPQRADGPGLPSTPACAHNPQVRCRLETPCALSGRSPTSRSSAAGMPCSSRSSTAPPACASQPTSRPVSNVAPTPPKVSLDEADHVCVDPAQPAQPRTRHWYERTARLSFRLLRSVVEPLKVPERR